MIGRNDAREKSMRPSDRKIAVAANRATVLIHELAVGEDDARGRLTVQIVAGAADDELGGAAECGILPIVEASRRLVVGDEQPDDGLAPTFPDSFAP